MVTVRHIIQFSPTRQENIYTIFCKQKTPYTTNKIDLNLINQSLIRQKNAEI